MPTDDRQPLVHIRTAEPTDAEAIAEVQVASWRAAYRGLMPDATLDAFTLELRTAAWGKNLTTLTPGLRTRVLERAGHVIAFCSCGASRDRPTAGEVWALYAHPDAWGTGAGRELLEDGLAALEAAGCREIDLWVLEGNARAIQFYEAAGFRLDGGHRVDAELPHLRMRREARRSEF